MSDPSLICPAQALIQLDPEFLISLSPEEQLVFPYLYDLWLRPEQIPPPHHWQYCGWIAGRGWGKSWAIAIEITRRIMRGEVKSKIALMAPTDDRVRDVQISMLLDVAPPWFAPEPVGEGLIWPNGVIAEAYTSVAPGHPRGGNFELSWLTELVDWKPQSRREAYRNITTATRVGKAQVLWDTTSKGKNEVILELLQLNREDRRSYPIIRGSMFDNQMLSKIYLQRECRKYGFKGREYEEEIEGKVFAESAGALFKQAVIERNRTKGLPFARPALRLVSVDPALSARAEADETGIMVGSRGGERDDSFIEHDLSDHYTPAEWGRIVVLQCLDNGAAGIVVERNHLGDNAAFVIQSIANAIAIERGISLSVRTLNADEPWPQRQPGIIFVREVHAATGKTSRASGPAAQYELNRVHHCGVFEELELQLTTYEPGESKSPNRYDSLVYLVIELGGLALDSKPDGKRAVSDAAALHKQLRERLRSRSVRRI